MSEISQLMRSLLRDALLASRAGRPLCPGRTGFLDVRGRRPLIHPFATCRAAERRGLVIITGERHRRRLLITATGLDAVTTIKRQKDNAHG